MNFQLYNFINLIQSYLKQNIFVIQFFNLILQFRINLNNGKNNRD